MNKETIDRLINNSVRWLNTVDPNWLNKVNTKYLNMTHNCILDQVFGKYETVIDNYPELKSKIDSRQYMFASHTQEWKEKIDTLKRIRKVS